MNFTTDYIEGSNEPLLEMDYVSFECPTGFVFEGSTVVKHYAICYNWSYVYTFNHSSALCARKYLKSASNLGLYGEARTNLVLFHET